MNVKLDNKFTVAITAFRITTFWSFHTEKRLHFAGHAKFLLIFTHGDKYQNSFKFNTVLNHVALRTHWSASGGDEGGSDG